MKFVSPFVITSSFLLVSMPLDAGFFSKKVRWDCVSPDDPNMRVTYYGKGQANVLKEGFLTPGSYPVKVVDQNTVTGQNRFGENFTCTRPSENE
jgi:hypothetical protein